MKQMRVGLLCVLSIFSPALLAQTVTCTSATLNGKYGFAISGLFYQSGRLYPFAEAGTITTDGKGNFTGSETYSEVTPTPTNSYGTYVVNADCTGVATFLDTGSHISFVVTADGQQVDFIQTDTGTVISGGASRQLASCTTATISGAYGFALEGWYYSSGGLFAYADSGKVTADGAGGLSLQDTPSYGGSVSSRTISGRASVNSDCTGTATFTDSQGNASHLNFVVVSGGRQIQFIQTDANTIISGSSNAFSGATVGGGSMAHYATGGGWQTTFTLINTGTTTAQAQLSFTDDNGSAQSIPLSILETNTTSTASSISQTIPPGNEVIIVSQSTGAEQHGLAQLTTSGTITGFCVFRNVGSGQEAVVPLETRTAYGYVLSFDNTSGLFNGVALSNLTNAASTVQVMLRDDGGNSLGTGTINLSALGHISFVLASNYSAVANKRGTVEFDAPPGQAISVIGLRFNPNGAFTTIPVMAK